jgi:hypothetical protein
VRECFLSDRRGLSARFPHRLVDHARSDLSVRLLERTGRSGLVDFFIAGGASVSTPRAVRGARPRGGLRGFARDVFGLRRGIAVGEDRSTTEEVIAA